MAEIIIEVDDKFLKMAKVDGMEDQYELIRCKDCRYNADCVCVWHSGNDYTWIVVDDDYCSCAERREE